MPDRLSRLVQTIIGSFPIKDPHPEKGQQGRIVDLHTIHHSEPFSPSNHVCPQPIIEEKVREDVIPPVMVCSRRILPFFDDSVKGILGDLKRIPLSVSSSRNEEGDYLVSRWVVTITRRWGMNPFVETLNLPKKPTHGQLDDRLLDIVTEDQRTDDRMLHVGY